MKSLKGACLCGQVTIEVADDFAFVGYCHCSECRKWSGSAFATGGMVEAYALRITGGDEAVTRYRKSDETELAFCSRCGSSLFSTKLRRGMRIVRLGILDDIPAQPPNVHIYCASKAPWFDIADALPQFDELPA